MDGDLQRTFGRNLRTHRRRLGLSQEAMAERLNCHRTFVGGIERGERNLTLLSVERLSADLGVHPLELLWDRDGIEVTVDGRGPALLAVADVAAVEAPGSNPSDG